MASDGGTTDSTTMDSPAEATSDGMSDAMIDSPVDASAPPWAAMFGAGFLQAVAVDNAKDILVGGSAVFLEKRDFASTMLWKKAIAPAQTTAITTDASNNVYVAADVNAPVDFGGGMTGVGAYVVKYDTTGKFLWQYGPFNGCFFFAIRTKSNGNVVVVGYQSGAFDFGGGLVGSNGVDALLVELTSSKQYVRDKRWGGTYTQMVLGLAIDANDNMFLSTNFSGQIDFGGGALNGPQASSHSIAIAKLDANANYVKQIDLKANTANGFVKSLGFDSQGRLYAGGDVEGDSTIDFGGGPLTSNGGSDVALALLDSSLGHVWSKNWGDANGQFLGGLAVDTTDGIGLAGTYTGTPDFGLGALPNGINSALFVVRLDKNGKATASRGASVSNGVAAGQNIAFLQSLDWIMVGSCGGGTLALWFTNLACGNVNSGFAARVQP
jgi:hypothetical protein